MYGLKDLVDELEQLDWMGGYAFYVWSSVLVTFALLAIEVLWAMNSRKIAFLWVKAQKNMVQ